MVKPYLKDAITIDPGFSGTKGDGTGWAYWSGTKFPVTGLLEEQKKRGKVIMMPERIEGLFRQFDSLLTIYNPKKIYVESMAVWTGHAVSMGATDKLMNVQALVGGYCALAYAQGISFKMLLPNQWKGQANKTVIKNRIYRVNKKSYPNHTEDAVGIGFSVSGHL